MPSARTVGIGLAALGAAIAALLPTFLVVYPAAGISPAAAEQPEVMLPIVARNPALVTAPGILEVAGHAIGAVAIMGLWLRTGSRSFLLSAATLGGLLWTGVDLVDNLVTLQVAPALASRFASGDAAAAQSYLNASALLDAARLAGHFGGGLWVVGLSVFGLRTAIVNGAIAWTGLVVGAILATNPFVPALLNVSFVTLPIWLIVLGVSLARTRSLPALAVSPVPG